MDEVAHHERTAAELRETRATMNRLAGRARALEEGIQKIVDDFRALSRAHRRAASPSELVAYLEELL